MRNSIIVLLVMTPLLAQASGGHMSPERAKTLMYWSIFNFVIFAGALTYILRGKLVSLFNSKRDEVQAIYTQAMEKQKQAQRERDSYQMEIANLSSFEDKVMKETIGNTVKFKESYKKEIDEKIARVQKESEAKIRNTKASGEDQVKQQLIDAVIADTKSSMNSDAQLKAKVTTNLLNNI